MSRAGSRPRAVSFGRVSSPFGPILLAAGGSGLTLLEFLPEGEPESILRNAGLAPDQTIGRTHLERARSALEGYCDGSVRQFKLKLDLRAGSDFEQRVWREAIRIGYGRVLSYGELAARVGMPLGARAVGGALGRNPIPIVVPCHRVVQKDGGLGGFSSGTKLKRKLLTHEGFLLPELGFDGS